MIDITFANRIVSVDLEVAQALLNEGTIDRVRTDSGEYFLGADLAYVLFNQGLLHEDDSGPCGKGWTGTQGNCERNSNNTQPQMLRPGMTRGQKIRRGVAIAGGIGLATAAAYAAAKNKHSNSAAQGPSKYASTRVPQGVQGGPLALANKGSGQMARTAQIKKEIKKSMFRTRAERKAANAAKGKTSNTFFSAGSGTGKGRLSETIGNIPEGTSAREARRIKKRPAWLTPGYKKGKGG